jgi:3-oxoacyl-[acyl-carrier protein] reductase
MDIRFDGQVALITGASSGIGRASAIEFAKCGAQVVVNYNANKKAAKETVEHIKADGGNGIAIQADVTKKADVDRLVGETLKAFNGRIDILLNNAGTLVERKSIEDMSEKLWDDVMDVNAKSVFLCTNAVIPIMKKQGHGKILNMTSVAARNGGGFGAGAYSASKAAVLTLTKNLAKELSQYGILVNGISPGVISTPYHDTFSSTEMRENFKKAIPLHREGTPEEVAWTVLFLASHYADYIVGENIEINGGIWMD